MSIVEELNTILNQYIRPASFPVAIKVTKDTKLPEDMKRPKTLLGYPINLCQGIAIARRYGWILGFQREDHACAPSLVILGQVEEPDFIKNGSIIEPLYTKTLDAGVITQKETPNMPVGEINSIVLAPLNKANFDPDVVLIYGNPGQMVRLVQGALYQEGGTIESKFMGRAACGGEIVTPLLTQKCNVNIPGGGEKVFALTGDDEMCFSVPKNKIIDLMEGIVATHNAGAARFPVPYFGLRMQPQFPPKYDELAKYCGL